ncbi:MAG: hypothetical protein U1E78_03990 [Gammaproteobacteria bacterium]
MTIIDAHLHLNGSVSLRFLKETSEKNNCIEFYNKFILETNPWNKFAWVHQIIQTIEDIARATIDVAEGSNADILEIRTTPKKIGANSETDYIQSFRDGLLASNNLYPQKKVRGLLSIDRTRHTLADAKRIIDAASQEKKLTGMIVGIDLSGNYLGDRKLTGNDLYESVKYALSKDIGASFHVGEIDSDIEKYDFDLILKAISEYEGDIRGKVRLGHAIYRSEDQNATIRRLKIPIEICPSCHEQLDWWKQSEIHPILNLYQKRTQVLVGTDDSLIFNCTAKEEEKKLNNIFIKDQYSELPEDEQDEIISRKRERYLFF